MSIESMLVEIKEPHLEVQDSCVVIAIIAGTGIAQTNPVNLKNALNIRIVE